MDERRGYLTYDGHLGVLRGMLLRIAVVTMCIAAVVFVFKEETFAMLLAPSECDFVTYRWICDFVHIFDASFELGEYHVDLIATDLSSQFMTHVSTAVYLGLLGASPFIVFELFRFVTPALRDDERCESADTTIIFILPLLTRSSTANPSSVGITRSRSSTSGRTVSSFSRTSLPLTAVSISSILSDVAKCAFAAAVNSSLSSQSIALIFMVSSFFPADL